MRVNSDERIRRQVNVYENPFFFFATSLLIDLTSARVPPQICSLVGLRAKSKCPNPLACRSSDTVAFVLGEIAMDARRKLGSAATCSSLRPEMHWSQPGEKKLTGGQNWQNKTMSTTQWGPAPMAPQPMPLQQVVRNSSSMCISDI